MRMKVRRELEKWEDRRRKQREGDGGSQEPRLTMSVIMQSRASFLNGETVGVDGISAGDTQIYSVDSFAEDREKSIEMRYLRSEQRRNRRRG